MTTNLHSVQLFVPFRKPERGMSDGDIFKADIRNSEVTFEIRMERIEYRVI